MRNRHAPFFRVATVVGCCALLQGAPSRAQVLRQVSDLEFHRMSEPVISADGGETLVVTNADLLGTNPRQAFQIFSFDSANGTPSQITHFPLGVEYMLRAVSLSADRSTLAFVARGDLAGNNADGSPEIFVMNRDGSEIVQVTDDPAPNAGSIYALALAGNATRVAFASTSDLVGANPAGFRQVYAAEVDGPGLTQLTNTVSNDLIDLDIDGSGEKIVFVVATGTVYSIAPDGSQGRGISSTRGRRARVSSDGNAVVLSYNPPSSGHTFDYCARRLDWELTSEVCLHGEKPGISGDGQRMFYPAIAGGVGVFVQPGNTVYWSGAGGNGVLVPPPPPESPSYASFDDISVSADGTQGALTRRYITSVVDGLDLLQVGIGAEPEMLIRLSQGPTPLLADIAHDGSLIAYITTEARPAANYLLYVVRPDGSGRQLVGESLPFFEPPLVSPDGQTIYFRVYFQPGNGLVAVDADGSNLRTIVASGGSHAQISANGQVLVYDSGGIYAAAPDGSGATLLAGGSEPRIDAAGAWVVFVDGGSIYRVSVSDPGPRQLINPDHPGASSPDISGDGTKIVYIAGEVFLYATDTQATTQLTLPGIGELTDARISADGRWVYFTAAGRRDEPDPDVFAQVFRVNTHTLLLERWFGLGQGARPPDPRTGTFSHFGATQFYSPAVELDGSGRTVFVAGGNLGGDNPGQWEQVWLADPNVANLLRVSNTSGDTGPTRLDWDVDPRFLRYDVIRGDVAQLRAGLGLGVVACLGDDAPLPGAADAQVPLSGQTFFYVYRGSSGLNLGSGTYGDASSGAERQPARGDCPG